MQAKIRINNINQITLPIAYHHIQQAAIYSLIKGNLHDQGYNYEKRDYKLFTFGPFSGSYIIKNKRITFYDSVGFEFRCLDESVMNSVVHNIKEYGFRLGDISYHNVSVELSDIQIETDFMSIKMISPICVYETDEFKHTNYFSPVEEEFYYLVEDNFIRKYIAAYGMEPASSISITADEIVNKDKYFTKYKNYYIEAWKGQYALEGDPAYLTFLYNTGLGAKNSQGFGMFNIQE